MSRHLKTDAFFDFHVFIKYKAYSEFHELRSEQKVQYAITDMQHLRASRPRSNNIVYHAGTRWLQLIWPSVTPNVETPLISRWQKVAGLYDDEIERLWTGLKIEDIIIERCPEGVPPQLLNRQQETSRSTTPTTLLPSKHPPKRSFPFKKPRNDDTPADPPQTRIPSGATLPAAGSPALLAQVKGVPALPATKVLPPTRPSLRPKPVTTPSATLPGPPTQVQNASASTTRTVPPSQANATSASTLPVTASAAPPSQARIDPASMKTLPTSQIKTAPAAALPVTTPPVPPTPANLPLTSTQVLYPSQAKMIPISARLAAINVAPPAQVKIPPASAETLLPAQARKAPVSAFPVATTTATTQMKPAPTRPRSVNKAPANSADAVTTTVQFSPDSNPPMAPTPTVLGKDDTVATSSTLTPAPADNQQMMRLLTRYVEESQKQIREAQVREHMFKRRLEHLGARSPKSAEEPQTTSELLAELNVARAVIQVERRRRVQAEKQLEEVNAERQSLFVVPALLEVFKEIDVLTDAVADVPMET